MLETQPYQRLLLVKTHQSAQVFSGVETMSPLKGLCY